MPHPCFGVLGVVVPQNTGLPTFETPASTTYCVLGVVVPQNTGLPTFETPASTTYCVLGVVVPQNTGFPTFETQRVPVGKPRPQEYNVSNSEGSLSTNTHTPSLCHMYWKFNST